jgi:hypothetical protein
MNELTSKALNNFAELMELNLATAKLFNALLVSSFTEARLDSMVALVALENWSVFENIVKLPRLSNYSFSDTSLCVATIPILGSFKMLSRSFCAEQQKTIS